MPRRKNSLPTKPKPITKKFLLNWVNTVLRTDFVKIEQLMTGAAYCQLLDIIYPSVISFRKIKFLCCYEKDFIYNFVLLQKALECIQIKKVIPITKLIKGDPEENLKFLIWFKKFFDDSNTSNFELDYDPEKARDYSSIGIATAPAINAAQKANASKAQPKEALTLKILQKDKLILKNVEMSAISTQAQTTVPKQKTVADKKYTEEEFNRKLGSINKRISAIEELLDTERSNSNKYKQKFEKIAAIYENHMQNSNPPSAWLNKMGYIINANNLKKIWQLDDNISQRVKSEVEVVT